MIEFRVLGGLDLRDAAGRSVSAILVHPKRTALLAYLAVASPHGFHRRDTLIALFWPESSQELARASLRKAVHHLRRALGDEVIVGRGDEELGIDPALLWCDAAAVETAIAEHDIAHALDLYRGPLLDGFFVADAPEFERWMELQRARLRTVAADAAWRMAESSVGGQQDVEAAVWARRAAALVPNDEAALRRLLTLLDRIGDRAGALGAYEQFARQLAHDYDVEPSAETRALIRGMRGTSSAVATAPPEIHTESRSAPESVIAPRKRTRARAILLTLVAFIALTVGWRLRTAGTASHADASSLAILPFEYRGAAEHAYLGGGIASLLGTSLDGIGDLHAVEAGGPAAAAGAASWVSGEVIEVAGRMRVSATMYDARHGSRVVARASAEDTLSRVFDIVDRLAAQLLTNRSGSGAQRLSRVAAVTTHSIPALKAYLEGERSFRVGHYKEAIDGYQHAVAADSTFALAYYRLALSYSWSSDSMAQPTARLAVRFAQHLSRPDRLLVEAFVPFIQGAADDAERRYRSILSTRPYDAEAWYPLGEVLFHYNPVRGRSIREAKPAFERALKLGPTDGPLTHLLEIDAIEGDYAAFDSLLKGIAPGAHFDVVGRTIHAFRSGGEKDRASMLSEIRALPDPEVANAGRHMLFLLDDAAGAERVIRLMLEPQRPREVQAQGYILLAHLRASEGRWRAADSLLVDAAQLDPARALEQRGLLQAMPFFAVPDTVRASTRLSLERWHPTTGTSSLVFDEDRGMHPYLRAYLIGLLDAQLGRDEGAQRTARELDTSAADGRRPFVRALAHGVRARSAWRRGRIETAMRELNDAYERDSTLDIRQTMALFGLVQERFLRAEVFEALDRHEEALAWYGSFGEHSPYARVFMAPSHLRRAQILEKLGRRAEARRQYVAFIEMWKRADPELQPTVQAAKRSAEALSP